VIGNFKAYSENNKKDAKKEFLGWSSTNTSVKSYVYMEKSVLESFPAWNKTRPLLVVTSRHVQVSVLPLAILLYRKKWQSLKSRISASDFSSSIEML